MKSEGLGVEMYSWRRCREGKVSSGIYPGGERGGGERGGGERGGGERGGGNASKRCFAVVALVI